MDCQEYSGRSYPSYQTFPNRVFSVVSGCGLEIDQVARRPSAEISYRLSPRPERPAAMAGDPFPEKRSSVWSDVL